MKLWKDLKLEDQVAYLTDAVQTGKLIDELGIKVLGVYPDILTAVAAVPGPYYFGDAFEVGTSKPYQLYIYTRKDGSEKIGEWIDFGPFPAPGPKGDKGYKGDKGDNGRDGERGPIGLPGPQGIQGLKGYKGATGPIGPQGPKGDKGDVGPSMNIQATLSSSDQLPTPTKALKDIGAAYLIPHTVVGQETHDHVWVIQGTSESSYMWVDIGPSGVQGPQGPAGQDGQGWNTLTDVNLTLGNTTVQYDTTNGIQINSVARFTDAEGNHDATMDLALPVVGKDGIIIDKAADSEKIEISGKNFVKKISSTAGTLIYTNVNGTDSEIGVSAGNEVGKVAQYYDEYQWPGDNSQGGLLVTATPTKPYHAANKKYVDDNFTPAYSSSLPVLWGGEIICYNNNKYGRCGLDTGTSEYTAVLRDTGGQINLPEIPARDYNAVCKKYVDDAIASISPTTQTKYEHNLILEGIKNGSTFKAFMSLMRDDNTTITTLDEVVYILGSVSHSCTGYIYDGNQKIYNVISFNPTGPVFEYNDPESGEQDFAVTTDDVSIQDDVLEF